MHKLNKNVEVLWVKSSTDWLLLIVVKRCTFSSDLVLSSVTRGLLERKHVLVCLRPLEFGWEAVYEGDESLNPQRFFITSCHHEDRLLSARALPLAFPD